MPSDVAVSVDGGTVEFGLEMSKIRTSPRPTWCATINVLPSLIAHDLCDLLPDATEPSSGGVLTPTLLTS